MTADVQTIRNRLADDPQDTLLRLRLAHALIDAAWICGGGDEQWKSCYAEAAEIYESLLSEQPDNEIALVNCGVALSDQGFHVRALSCYGRAESVNWIDGNLQYNLGVALVNLGDDDLSARHFRNSEIQNPHPKTLKAYFDPQAH